MDDALPQLRGQSIITVFWNSAYKQLPREYVAVTGAGADSLSLPDFLAAIPLRSRRRALTQLRCDTHWLAEETGRWLRPVAMTVCALIV